MITKLYARWVKFILDVKYMNNGGLKKEDWNKYEKAKKSLSTKPI